MKRAIWKLPLSCLLAVSMAPASAHAADAIMPVSTGDRASRLKAVDRLLEQADAQIRAIDSAVTGAAKTASPADERTSCRNSMTPEAIVLEVAKTWNAPDGGIAQMDPLIADIESYHLCLALARKDPGQCGPLKLLSESRSEICAEYYWDENMMRALMTRAEDAPSACIQSLSRPKHKKVAVDLPQFCSALVHYTRDADQTCAALIPLMQPDRRPNCSSMIKSFNGQADCAKSKADPAEAFWCEQHRALQKAFAAKNAGLCGERSFCRVLMGGGAQSCRPYSEKIKSRYCELKAKPRDAGGESRDAIARAKQARALYAEKETASSAFLKQAQSELLLLESATTRLDASSTQDIDSRAEKIARLQERLRRIGSAIPPAPAVPARSN